MSKLKGPNTWTKVRLMEFWAILAALKNEPRRGWKAKLGMKNPESVADHSYAVATTCLYIAWSRGGYDQGRLLKLALLHDLDEAFTGDLTPEDKQRLGKNKVAEKRQKAFQKILGKIPTTQGRDDYRRLWRDLSHGRSKEARLVKEVDLIEMVLQAQRYSIEASRGTISEFYGSALERLEDPELKLLALEIATKSKDSRQ